MAENPEKILEDENLDEESFDKEEILKLFFQMGGNLDKINAAIDAKLDRNRTRKITVFETFIKSRVEANPKVLKMAKLEIDVTEAIYLSQYPALLDVEILDLRQNHIGDQGIDAIAHSEILKNIKELDLRNNKITRVGVESLSKSTNLTQLERLDLRSNRLGKRWEEKLIGLDNFPLLKEVKTL